MSTRTRPSFCPNFCPPKHQHFIIENFPANGCPQRIMSEFPSSSRLFSGTDSKIDPQSRPRLNIGTALYNTKHKIIIGILIIVVFCWIMSNVYNLVSSIQASPTSFSPRFIFSGSLQFWDWSFSFSGISEWPVFL